MNTPKIAINFTALKATFFSNHLCVHNAPFMRTTAILKSDDYCLCVFCAAFIRTKIRGDNYENPCTDLFARSQRHPAGHFDLWCSDTKQILGLYPQKDEQIRNLLSYLCKQKRLFLVDGFYSLTPELPKDRDRGLEAAVTVLADFMEQVEYHAAGEYPVKIIFLAGGEVYEILYAEPGKEAILNLLLARPEQEPPVRLVILEDAAQVDLLAIPNVRAYCLLDGDGNIQYLQEETEGSF